MNEILVQTLPAPVRTSLRKTGWGWIKREKGQLTGSVKYRLVYARLRKALKEGAVGPGKVLVEVTSGSTGVALAYAGSCLGLKVELHAYSGIRHWKMKKIAELGAHLVLHPEGFPMARLLAKVSSQVSGGNYWHLGQYTRTHLVEAYQDLGREMIAQLLRSGPKMPRNFVCPVGTGGMIQGVGGMLRREFPDLRIIAVEPLPGVFIEGIRNTCEFHLGMEDPYNLDFPDRTVHVGPPRKSTSGFGESTAAALEAVRSEKLSDSIILAPD